MQKKSIWIGWDDREAVAWYVTRHSIVQRLSAPIPIHGIMLKHTQAQGLYRRPTGFVAGRLYDHISEHPMATEFAISRFLTPYLHTQRYGATGWAAFMDCDMLARCDLNELFWQGDPRYAVMCVKHNHVPINTIKMDNQVQSQYARKNWSSVMLFNLDHPANARLSLDMINGVPGRDLHRFCWLQDNEIGELDPRWNYLVGDSPHQDDPFLVHFTNGWPGMKGYESVQFADEWWMELESEVVEPGLAAE